MSSSRQVSLVHQHALSQGEGQLILWTSIIGGHFWKVLQICCVHHAGNHDLWVRRGEKARYDSIGASLSVAPSLCASLLLDSLAYYKQQGMPVDDTCCHAGKMKAVFAVCTELGVRTVPACVNGLWIVPLLSWYHKSWDREPDLAGAAPAHKVNIWCLAMVDLPRQQDCAV